MVWLFSASKSSDTFWLFGGYHWVEKCWNRIANCLERLQMQALGSLEGFSESTNSLICSSATQSAEYQSVVGTKDSMISVYGTHNKLQRLCQGDALK